MLYATAGCRLFIAAPSFARPDPATRWLQVGEAEALGLLGGTWQMDEVNLIGLVDEDGTPIQRLEKSYLQRSAMQVILGNDPADPGQAILWQAFRDPERSYPFRLLWPDGVTDRRWLAQVVALFEVYDTANAVMKLQADLLPASKIWRGEDT